MNKILSIFIDESSDFGEYDHKAHYYMVAMVLHDQQVDISSDINSLDLIIIIFKYKFIIFILDIIEIEYIIFRFTVIRSFIIAI